MLHESCRQTKRGPCENFPGSGGGGGMIDRRWMNTQSAAEYCDYSASRFRRLVKEFSVPGHGPERNRYDRYELDAWMTNPRCFIQTDNSFPARRKAGGFTPVHCLLAELLNVIDEDTDIVLLKRKDPATPLF